MNAIANCSGGMAAVTVESAAYGLMCCFLIIEAARNAAAVAINGGMAAAQKTRRVSDVIDSNKPPRIGPTIEPTRPIPSAQPKPVERIAVG